MAIAVALACALIPGLASAYVGPGAGISMLGALWGLIIGVVMAIGVILFWPIRMMIRKAKANKEPTENAISATATDGADDTTDSASPDDSSSAT